MRAKGLSFFKLGHRKVVFCRILARRVWHFSPSFFTILDYER
jgi:hypothetical protein